MPLYEYECVKCGRRTERIESVAGPHLKKCPHCGGRVESLISAPAIQFKGTGWYVTDYSGKSDKSEKPASETKDTAKESPSKEPSAKESPAKETKEKKAASKK